MHIVSSVGQKADNKGLASMPADGIKYQHLEFY